MTNLHDIPTLDPLPTPTQDQPLAQIEWLFERKKNTITRESTQKQLYSALSIFSEFWRVQIATKPELREDPRIFIRKHCTASILMDFKLWMDAENAKHAKTSGKPRWAQGTEAGYLGRVTGVIRYAVDQKWIDDVIPVYMPDPVREGDGRTAYSDPVLAAIMDKNRPWLLRTNRLLRLAESSGNGLNDYRRTGIGVDPRGYSWITTEAAAYRDIDNMRWYFENVLHCVPIAINERENRRKHIRFCRTAEDCFGGDEIYAQWGPSLDEYQQLPDDAKTTAYAKTGVGRDPRGGWRNEENIRWYFENVMNCVPLTRSVPNFLLHPTFFSQADKFHGGYRTLYEKWGVAALIDLGLIMPLAIKLTYETGLNVESLLSLKRGCLKTDELTGLPYVQYFKRRSGGDKFLPISLLDQQAEEIETDNAAMEQAEEGDQDLDEDTPQYLPIYPTQAQLIRHTIDSIEALTRPLVSQAAEGDQDCLFLHQTLDNVAYGETKRITPQDTYRWMRYQFNQTDYCLIDVNSDKTQACPAYCDIKTRTKHTQMPRHELTLNLARFRPTRVTDLIRQGYDIVTIQHIMGHVSVFQTIEYLSKHNLLNDFYKEVSTALLNIKKNASEYKRRVIPIAVSSEIREGEAIYRTSLCHCKNPHDPDDIVKARTGWKPGDTCHYYNLCLRCDKVLITEHSLPKLFAYRRHIKAQLDRGLANLPDGGQALRRDAMILDQILVSTPDNPFTEAELEHARQLSLVNDEAWLDAYMMQGVMQ